MKRVILSILVILGAIGLNAQKVIVNDGTRDLGNNTTYVVAPETLNNEVIGTFTLKNTTAAAVDFTIATEVKASVAGATNKIVFDGTDYTAGTTLNLAADGSKAIKFVVSSPDFGATKLNYSIIAGGEKYQFNIVFYYTTLNFAELIGHKSEDGDATFSSTQMPEYSTFIFPTDEETGEIVEDATIFFNVRNIDTKTNSYKFKQARETTVDGWDYGTCFGTCVVGDVAGPVPVGAGMAIQNEPGDLGADIMIWNNGIDGKAMIRVSVINAGGEADSLSWLVEVNRGQVGVNDRLDSSNTAKFSNVYPNPVKNFVNISCEGVDGTATLTIYNMTGAKIMERVADAGNGKISVNVSELKNGLYLYSISLDGKSIETKKFVINR